MTGSVGYGLGQVLAQLQDEAVPKMHEGGMQLLFSPPATPSNSSSVRSNLAFFKASAEIINPVSLAMETTASTSADAVSFS